MAWHDFIMNPQEFKEKMEHLKNANDPEVTHEKADALMCEVLSALGYAEGVQIFKELTKWYA